MPPPAPPPGTAADPNPNRPQHGPSPLAAALRRAWLAALVLLGFAGLAACSQPVTPPLVVGMNAWVGYDPLVLARDRGLADPRLLKVVELSSSSETLRHVRNGLLDAAALTLDEALRLIDSGFEVRIVALLDASAGADVVLAAPRIREAAQLRGERIAVESSTVGALMLPRLLQSAGLQRGDVEVVGMDATQHLLALQSGRVAAAVSYEPIAGSIRAAGFHRIFDSRQIPGEILNVLVVTPRALAQQPQAVDALLAAWAGGLRVLRQDPQGAARDLAPGAGLSGDGYLGVLGGLRFYEPEASRRALAGQPSQLSIDAEPLAASLMNTGLLHRLPDWPRVVDPAPGQRSAGSVP